MRQHKTKKRIIEHYPPTRAWRPIRHIRMKTTQPMLRRANEYAAFLSNKTAKFSRDYLPEQRSHL